MYCLHYKYIESFFTKVIRLAIENDKIEYMLILSLQLMSKGNLLKSGKEVLSYSNSRKRVYKPDGTFNEDDFIRKSM